MDRRMGTQGKSGLGTKISQAQLSVTSLLLGDRSLAPALLPTAPQLGSLLGRHSEEL